MPMVCTSLFMYVDVEGKWCCLSKATTLAMSNWSPIYSTSYLRRNFDFAHLEASPRTRSVILAVESGNVANRDLKHIRRDDVASVRPEHAALHRRSQP